MNIEKLALARVPEFLISPKKILRQILIFTENIKSFLIWGEYENIYFSPSADNLWEKEKLIFFFIDNSEEEEGAEKKLQETRNALAKIKGKTNIGKFFIYPIWVNKTRSDIFISQYGGKTKKISLAPSLTNTSIFNDFLGDIIVHPPKNNEECFEYKLCAQSINENDIPIGSRAMIWTLKKRE
ncbi:MAG: hypothetical protein V1698_01370 [bacterium]